MKDIRVSVAMATYNGEKYIKEQLDSILNNLTDNDEIIISDDGSTDNTLNIIKNYNDERIKMICGPKAGIKKNFENAIKHCNGKYIFLSDQDDIWMNNKVEILLNEFNNKKCDLILHDAIVFNSDNNDIIYNSFFNYRRTKKGILNNLIKNNYIGCCMAFDKNLRSKILPIPNNIKMHDQWIGILAEKYAKVEFINDKLIKYRRHINNVTDMKHDSIFNMIKMRIIFIKEYLKRK